MNRTKATKITAISKLFSSKTLPLSESTARKLSKIHLTITKSRLKVRVNLAEIKNAIFYWRAHDIEIDFIPCEKPTKSAFDWKIPVEKKTFAEIK